MKENIIFLPSKIAPNPMEASYWIDLKEDPTGAVIKVWNGATWKPISGDTEVVAMLQEEIKRKLLRLLLYLVMAFKMHIPKIKQMQKQHQYTE